MGHSNASVSQKVVETVATETGTDPMELPVLYDAINVDALDTLVSTWDNVEISFRYAGHTVTVSSKGAIQLDESVVESNETANA